ncbi:MAG TPA: formyltransferase family protein, partial [Pseudobdellovibrionaceae bacterium]|nr:formyltransferase family protein [Pseudobdellovibrionaceae bacterium]
MKDSIRSRRWAVFISGRGSNLQALLDQATVQEIRWVLSSKESAPGLLRAKRAGVPYAVLPKKIDWDELDGELRNRGITDLFLAGFMKLVPAPFVERWEGRMLNVHPSLLPAYPGLRAFEKSYEEKQEMGVTAHIV